MNDILFGNAGLPQDVMGSISDALIEAQGERYLQDLEEASCLYNLSCEDLMYV